MASLTRMGRLGGMLSPPILFLAISRTNGRRKHGTRHRRELVWWLAALLLVVVVGGLGCDPVGTIGFLAYPFYPNNDEPAFPLTLAGKESKVVFICGHEDNAAPNDAFRDADLTLCRQLTTMLAQRYKENKDKVKIVPISTVYAYLREHKDWVTQSKQEIGKHFDADFVVYLELGPMTMYEHGSSGTLYRGNVEIRITVFDVHQPEGEGIKPDQFYSCTYPTTHPEDAGTMRPDNFRAKFLDRVAKDLVPYFASHPPNDKLDKMES